MGSMKDLLGDTPFEERYPASPGFTEPTTSRDAAKAAAQTAETLRARALDAIRVRPMTADEVANDLQMSVLSIRPRISELRATTKIKPSGIRRKNASGQSATVWEIVV